MSNSDDKKAGSPESAAYAETCFAQIRAGRWDEALVSGRTALRLGSNDPAVFNAVGYLLHRHGDPHSAIDYFRKAVTLYPGFADAYHNLGISLQVLGRLREAAASYGRAIKLAPGTPAVYYNLALTLEQAGDFGAALDVLDRLLRIEPEHLEGVYRRAYLKRLVCDWSNLQNTAGEIETVIDRHVETGGASQLSPYALNIIGVSQACHRRAAEYYARQVAARIPVGHRTVTHTGATGHDRLRLAYLSPDFCAHAVGGLIADLIANHDRRRVAVTAYSQRSRDDEVQRQIRSDVETFRDVTADTPVEIAELIARDEIDVLVDLAGYTQLSRPEILALRPAPVQVSYLGYLNTMGADCIDYMVGDRVVTPSGHDDRFVEKIIRLPVCFMAGAPSSDPETAAERAGCGLPEGGTVFCSFNNPYKITPDMLDVWVDIVSDVPDAVLWLYTGADPVGEKNLREQITRRGLDEKSVLFAPRVSMREHMRRLSCADLFLDTAGYGAGATAVAAFQAGVPVLTLEGDTVLSRMGVSMNRSAGMEALICDDMEQYRGTAKRFGLDETFRNDIRASIRRAKDSAGVLDVRGLARALETAFEIVHKRHVAGESPRSVEPGEIT